MRKTGVAMIVAMLGASAGAQTITDSPAFNSVISGLHRNAIPTDKFAEPLAFPLDGKSFKLTIPAADSNEGSGGVIYDYKDGVLTLDVTPTTLWPRSGMSETLPGIIVSSNTKNLGTSLAQNAFGAVAQVRSFQETGAAIAMVSSPKAMLSPLDTDHHFDNMKNSDWWVRLTLTPSQAKAIALDTIGIVEGTYTKLPSGSAGACHFSGASATIDQPSSLSIEICYVGANITRIALARRSSGELIKEWTLENSPHLGPVLWDNIRAGMTKLELATAVPAITDYGYIEADEAQVEMTKEAVSSIQVRNWPAKGKALAKYLTARYGTPREIDCGFDATCEGKWAAGEGVAAYMINGWVTYQLEGDKPPVTHLPRSR